MVDHFLAALLHLGLKEGSKLHLSARVISGVLDLLALASLVAVIYVIFKYS